MEGINLDNAVDLPHDELVEFTQSLLGAIFKSDSLLQDLPEDITTQEILSQIAVEHGQSITIFVNRYDAPSISVIVPQDATVGNLKTAFAIQFEIFQRRNNIANKISWKYFWSAWSLYYDSIELDNNDDSIQNYGITNKVTLTFKKKTKKKK